MKCRLKGQSCICWIFLKPFELFTLALTFVYVFNRIEKMWIRDGAGYFFGPIFIHPEETEHEPTKMFYKKEVFLSNLEETCPMTCIIGSLCCDLEASAPTWWFIVLKMQSLSGYSSSLQESVSFCPSKSSCHVGPLKCPKMMFCFVRVATLKVKNRWRSSRVWSVSRSLERW